MLNDSKGLSLSCVVTYTFSLHGSSRQSYTPITLSLISIGFRLKLQYLGEFNTDCGP